MIAVVDLLVSEFDNGDFVVRSPFQFGFGNRINFDHLIGNLQKSLTLRVCIDGGTLW